MTEVKDFLGNILNPGDFVFYPAMAGNSVGMVYGRLEAVVWYRDGGYRDLTRMYQGFDPAMDSANKYIYKLKIRPVIEAYYGSATERDADAKVNYVEKVINVVKAPERV